VCNVELSPGNAGFDYTRFSRTHIRPVGRARPRSRPPFRSEGHRQVVDGCLCLLAHDFTDAFFYDGPSKCPRRGSCWFHSCGFTTITHDAMGEIGLRSREQECCIARLVTQDGHAEGTTEIVCR